jgi:hypothetical protein
MNGIIQPLNQTIMQLDKRIQVFEEHLGDLVYQNKVKGSQIRPICDELWKLQVKLEQELARLEKAYGL